MRIRSIKPEFWRSDDIAEMDWDARFVFIGLWTYVDDNGVGRDNSKLICADLFPLEDNPRDTLARVSRALQTLENGGRITRYRADGRDLLHITNWDRHQKIDRPNKPRYPLPTSENAEIRETLATVSRDPREDSSPGTEEQGNRGTRDQGSEAAQAQPARKRATRLPADWQPSEADLQWAREKAPYVNAALATEKFRNYWHAKAGKDATKHDWLATWRNWILNETVQRGGSSPSSQRGPTSKEQKFAAAERMKTNPNQAILDRFSEPEQKALY